MTLRGRRTLGPATIVGSKAARPRRRDRRGGRNDVHSDDDQPDDGAATVSGGESMRSSRDSSVDDYEDASEVNWHDHAFRGSAESRGGGQRTRSKIDDDIGLAGDYTTVDDIARPVGGLTRD